MSRRSTVSHRVRRDWSGCRGLASVLLALVAIVGTSLTFAGPAASTPTSARLTVKATSNPASGSAVDAGATVTYTLTATSLEALPSGGTIIDDLSGLLGHATVASSEADLAKQSIAVDPNANTLTWATPVLGAPGTQTSVATASFQVVVDGSAAGGTKLTTAAAAKGITCNSSDGCATALTVAGAPAPPATSPTTTSTLPAPSQATQTSTTTTAPTTPAPVVAAPAIQPAAAAPLALCTDPQNPIGSAVVGGFELDGNLCQNFAANADWSTVGGQPIATDGFNDSTQFTQGSAERDWPWTVGQVSGNGTAGNAQDIGNVYAFTQIAGGRVFTYFGFDRNATSGSTAYYVELNQLPNRPTGSQLPGPVPNRTNGDLRLVFNQQGSTFITLVGADRWSSTGPNTGSWVRLPSTAGFTG